MFYADKYSCPLGSWPISFDDYGLTDSHFDYTTSFENVAFSDSRGLIIDGCKASSSYGVDDIVITDIDGSFVSSIDASASNETGVLMSHVMQTFSECIELPDTCMQYCSDVCLQTISYKVEQYETEEMILRVTGKLCLFHENLCNKMAPHIHNHFDSIVLKMTMATLSKSRARLYPEMMRSTQKIQHQDYFLCLFQPGCTKLSLLIQVEVLFGPHL